MSKTVLLPGEDKPPFRPLASGPTLVRFKHRWWELDVPDLPDDLRAVHWHAQTCLLSLVWLVEHGLLAPPTVQPVFEDLLDGLTSGYAALVPVENEIDAVVATFERLPPPAGARSWSRSAFRLAAEVLTDVRTWARLERLGNRPFGTGQEALNALDSHDLVNAAELQAGWQWYHRTGRNGVIEETATSHACSVVLELRAVARRREAGSAPAPVAVPKLKDRERRILSLLAQSGEPMPGKQIAAKLGMDDNGTFRGAISNLVNYGLAVKLPRNGYELTAEGRRRAGQLSSMSDACV